jgi:hypothetical protein
MKTFTQPDHGLQRNGVALRPLSFEGYCRIGGVLDEKNDQY